MSFDRFERSVYKGRPAQLYKFERGLIGGVQYVFDGESFRPPPPMSWCYTSADRDIFYRGDTYIAIAISDEGISQSGDAQQDDFNVTIPTDNPVVELFRRVPPSDQVWLTVRRLHFDSLLEGETADVAPVMWVGTISNANRQDAASSKLLLNTLSTSFRRGGARLGYERNCPYMLYDFDCTVNKEDFAIPATVTAVSGDGFTAPEVSAFATGYFDGGFVEWKVGPFNYERRAIIGDAAITLAATVAAPSNVLIPQKEPDKQGRPRGDDFLTLLDILYPSEVRRFHNVAGTDYLFLRKDQDVSEAVANPYNEHWIKVFEVNRGNRAILYRWDNQVPYVGDQDGFQGGTTVHAVGDTSPKLSIIGSTVGMVPGTNVRLFPGCDRTTGPNGCTRFNNLPNMGGFPQMPGRSPFDGNPVF